MTSEKGGQEAVGKLFVGILEADHLPALDLNGFSDPYCIAEFEDARFKTAVIKESLKPHWKDENFEFDVMSPLSKLVIYMFDKDNVGQDDFIGMVTIDLKYLEDQKLHDAWFALKPRTDRDVMVQGEIRLRLHYTFDRVSQFFATYKEAKKAQSIEAEPPEEFKVKVLVGNIYRVLAQIAPVIDAYNSIWEWLSWERPARSFVALVVFITLCYHPNSVPVAIPVALAIYTAYQWVITGGKGRPSKDIAAELAKKEADEAKKAESQGNIFDSIQYYQEWLGWLQGLIGWIADTIDWYKDLFLWVDPDITKYVFGGLVVFFLLNLIVPIRVTILITGLYLFLRGSAVYTMGYLLYLRVWRRIYRSATPLINEVYRAAGYRGGENENFVTAVGKKDD